MSNSYVKNGIRIFEVSVWEDLVELFSKVFRGRLSYAFRGQKCEDWELTPSLTRVLLDERKFCRDNPRVAHVTVDRHLEYFKRSIVGRRGRNPRQLTDNEIWAIGQHYGLKTPLLDWTKSPYVATYFAFREELGADEDFPRCAVWAVDIVELEFLSQFIVDNVLADEEIRKNRYGIDRGVIEVVTPLTDENKRLISQSGLFIKIPFGTTLEEWAAKYFKNRVMKFTVPNSERDKILRALDEMNINDASLFPDLSGSAGYCNYMLEIHGNGSKNEYAQRLGGYSFTLDRENLAD